MKQTPVYSSFSNFTFAKYLVFKCILAYYIYKFSLDIIHEFNLKVLLLVIIPMVLIFSVVDQRVILVYKDRIRIQKNYLFGLFNSHTDFLSDDINEIEIEGEYGLKSDIIEDFMSLIFHKSDKKNKLIISTTNGKKHSFDLWIYKKDIQNAVRLLGFQTK